MIKTIKIKLILLAIVCVVSCEKENKINYEKVVNGGLVFKMFEQMKSNGHALLKEKDTSNLIKNIIKKETKLFFRFNKASCGICVDSVLLNLNRFSEKHNLKDNIVILTAYNNNRDVYVFKKTNNVQFDVINIKEGLLNLPADKEEKPFLFISNSNSNSNSNLICKSFFIPEKSWPFLTRKYLEHVKNTYFKELDEEN